MYAAWYSFMCQELPCSSRISLPYHAGKEYSYRIHDNLSYIHETGQLVICCPLTDRHYYDPNIKKMTWQHEITDEKCYPTVCCMPTFAVEMNKSPQSLQPKLLWATMGIENLQICVSWYEDYDGQGVCFSIWQQITNWPVSHIGIPTAIRNIYTVICCRLSCVQWWPHVRMVAAAISYYMMSFST